MARYTEAVCRLCRREGIKLYLKGERCYMPKCPMDRRAVPPGQHGQTRRKDTPYGAQMREKQKARRIYGVLERQFRRYFALASKAKGVTGEALLQLLERRFDNVIYRMGFAGSRAEARQLVRHGHFRINDRKVNIPSYLVREGDVITVAPRSRDLPRLKELRETGKGRTAPGWMQVDLENLRGSIVRMPLREEIDVPVKEHLIVELYSK